MRAQPVLVLPARGQTEAEFRLRQQIDSIDDGIGKKLKIKRCIAHLPGLENCRSVGRTAFNRIDNLVATTNVVIDVVGWYDDLSVSGGMRFHPLTPIRIVDSRTRLGLPSALGPAEAMAITVPAGLGTTRTAALVTNLTAIAPTAGTYLTVWPTGPRPLASSLNVTAGVTAAGMVTTALSDARQFTLFRRQLGG